MNALDEQIEDTLRSHEDTVGKVVNISRNDDPGLNFAPRKAFFTTKYQSQCIDKV